MSDTESHADIHKSHSAEILAWDDEDRERIKGVDPNAKYGAVSESLRHSVPEKQVCSMFCGGTDCKYCNPAGPKAPWKDDQMEIKGLFSNWVTENILSMSRPTTKAMEKFNIIGQFKEAGIKSIINLQQPGEHMSCGFGNEAEGFSYRPQDFMDQDIFFYNFGWKDYGVGSLENIMDMVKVMQFAISQGKVAVHCHAGLGRTGVLIAVYLLYANRESPNHVIHYIRSKRKGAVQTRSQIECIREFAEYLKPLRIVFSTVSEEADEDAESDQSLADFSLRQFMIRQQAYLHGQEAKRLKYVPKIVYCCCQRLLELAGRAHRHEFHDSYQDIRSTAPKAFLNDDPADGGVGGGSGSAVNGTGLQLPLHATARLRSRESYTALGMTTRSHGRLVKSLSGSSLVAGVDPGESSALVRSSSSSGCLSGALADQVADAMAMAEYSETQLQAVAKYKDLLNKSGTAYDALYAEQDPAVVAALVWHWLDALREPVLHPQDMPAMLGHDDPAAALLALDKASRGVIEVLFYTLARLLPSDHPVHEDLYCRVISTLTHQNMMLDMDYLHASTASSLRLSRTSNTTGVMRSHLADRLLCFFVAVTRSFQRKIGDARKKRERLKNDGSEAGELTRNSSAISSRLSSVSSSSSGTRGGQSPGPLADDRERGRDIPFKSYKSDLTKSDGVQSNLKVERSDSSGSNDSEIESTPVTKDSNLSFKNQGSDFLSSRSRIIDKSVVQKERQQFDLHRNGNPNMSEDENSDSGAESAALDDSGSGA